MLQIANPSTPSVAAKAEASPQQFLESAFCELPHIDGLFLIAPTGEVIFTTEEEGRYAGLPELAGSAWKFAQRTSIELERGKINYIAMQSQRGHIVATRLLQGHMLILLGQPDVRLGLVLYDMEWLSAQLSLAL